MTARLTRDRPGRLVMPCLVATIFAFSAAPADARTATEARDNAILWLSRRQNADGSWGAYQFAATRALATAEALLALSKAKAGDGVAAERALAWLRRQELAAVDYRARRVRAFAALGLGDADREADALDALRGGTAGWGVTGPDGPSSCDTSLALGALHAATRLPAPTVVNDLVAAVLARRRGDSGWSGDDVPSSAGASDLTLTAEITRALAGTANPALLEPTFVVLEAPANSATPTLEVAARLAALRAHGRQNAAVSALETELLRDARFVSYYDDTWSEDPLVNALGLLALGAPPSSYVAPSDSDLDQDGRRDLVDGDRDGDGVLDVAFGGLDVFPSDPGEWTDLDADGTGNGADTDDDGDGISDAVEITDGGLDSRNPDSDGDRFADGLDGRVSVARLPGGWDLQPNGYVDGEQEPGTDPLDPADHPGKPGDVAPLGAPNGKVGPADALVARRAHANPSLVSGLAGQRRTLTELARDADGDGDFDAADVLALLRRTRADLANP